MKSRLGLVLCLIAGFQLLGGHWAILQTAAWVGMVIDYSKTVGVEAGITKTFDGKHPCSLCLSIAQSKEKEGKQTTNLNLGKLDLVYQATRWTLSPPPVRGEMDIPLYRLTGSTHRPSVPPPRQDPG
jgi:hypothetical protein